MAAIDFCRVIEPPEFAGDDVSTQVRAEACESVVRVFTWQAVAPRDACEAPLGVSCNARTSQTAILQPGAALFPLHKLIDAV